MLRMASNLSGISTLWRRAQLRTRTLASSKRLPLPFFCSQKCWKELAGSVSGSVLVATIATMASTISSWPFWWQSTKPWLGGQLTERSALTQILRLPSSSTQIWFSSTWKYFECSQILAQPSKHSMRTQRLSGKGMSLISLRRTRTCSTYTRAMQLCEQISWLACCRMKRVFTTFGCRLRQLKDFRQQLYSSSFGQISRYSSIFSPVRRCRSVRNCPNSSGASSYGWYSQSSGLNSGVSMGTLCLLPIMLLSDYQTISHFRRISQSPPISLTHAVVCMRSAIAAVNTAGYN